MSETFNKRRDQSIKLAKLWAELEIIETKIKNEILPACGYLQIEDAALESALENLAERIGDHFANFNLAAIPAAAAELPSAK